MFRTSKKKKSQLGADKRMIVDIKLKKHTHTHNLSWAIQIHIALSFLGGEN